MIPLDRFRALTPALLRLAGPVALARLGIMGMGVADTIMVGQMAPAELPAQALGWAPTAVFLVSGIGLLTGVQVLTARVIGEGRPEAAGRVWRRGVAIALGAGLLAALAIWAAGPGLLTVFGVHPALAGPAARVSLILALSVPLHLVYVACAFFLEAIQRPVAATVVMWTANVVNIALNAWLIPHWGAEGSAWATAGSRLFLAGVLVVWILTLREGRRFGLRGRPTTAGPGLAAMLGVGVAAALSQAVEAGAFSAMTVIAGRISAETVAAYQILLNLLALVFMVALGLAAATSVLVSEAVGRRDLRHAWDAGWTGLGLNTAAMILAAVAFLLGGDLIARAYTADPALAALVAASMGVAALVLIPDGGQVVAAAALRARGDNWFPTASHVLAYAVVMPPLGWLLAEAMGRGVAGLIEAIAIASVVSVGVLLGRWALIGRSALAPAPAAA